MRRRRLLALLAGGVAGISGCSVEDGGETPADTTAPDRDSTTRVPTTTATSVERSRFEGVDPPSLPGVASTVWYHEAGPETPVRLRPSAERVDLPATLTCTLLGYEGGVGRMLWKVVDGTAFRLEPLGPGERLVQIVENGSPEGRQSRTWHLRHGRPDGGDRSSVGFLGGGRYAVALADGRRAYAALVDVEAPPVAVEPGQYRSTSRDGSAVVVEAEREPDEREPTVQVTVERADGAPRRLLAEQVLRYPGLRYTLPFFESGVERVDFLTPPLNPEWPGDGGPYPITFRFEGQAYRAESAVVGSSSDLAD